MKKRKWLLPVCIAAGILFLLLIVLIAAAGIMSAQGYGFTVGKLFFADNGVYLVEDDDMAMLVSDQSRDKDLFSGYVSGDKVLLLHDGVEESLPARTGGYHAFRISKGDGNYKPDGDVLGIVTHDGNEGGIAAPPIDFKAQYIRTDGYHEGAEYPVVKIIRSVEELNAYYEANKGKYDLERKEKVYSDTTIGFLDASDKYDKTYFEKQVLVMVLLEEGNGSNRHKVSNVGLADDGKMTVHIETIVPEVGTCDMAEWHILIEPEAGCLIKKEADVTVLIDGVNRHTQPTLAQHSRGYASISLSILDGWEYETEEQDGGDDFGIAFWPAGQSEGKIEVWYYDAFGVYGTGLEQEKITIGVYEANKGTYDNKKVWDFISLNGTPGQYVVMNEGAEVWWSEYGAEAMQILSTLQVADGIIDETEAIKIAKQEVTVKYDETYASFDGETGLWTVSFSKKNTLGGNQDVVITHEGKVVENVYGE